MYEKLYKELLLRYNELEGRTKQLEEENARFRQMLGMTEQSASNTQTAENTICSINKYSSAKEKIDLFRSLFKGREDVFARRWQSTATGKSGYQPVCKNEWAEGL